MLASYVLALADARLAQRNARLALEMAATAASSAPASTRARAIEVPGPSAVVLAGDAIAELSIPRVRLSAVVLHGSDTRTLRRGPGHVESTALPGRPGNVVIAGHRDTFFRPLRDVREGDDVFMMTPGRRVHYRVTSLRVVNPRDLSVLAPTAEPTLTLITCYPFWVFGDAPDRFVVRARVVTGVEDSGTAEEPPTNSDPIGSSSRIDGRDLLQPHRVPVTLDDGAIVRQVVERYRLAYNARVVQKNQATSGLLTFHTCDVSITGTEAMVSCEASSQSQNGLEQQIRRFTLERAGAAWAIRAMVTEGGS